MAELSGLTPRQIDALVTTAGELVWTYGLHRLDPNGILSEAQVEVLQRCAELAVEVDR